MRTHSNIGNLIVKNTAATFVATNYILKLGQIGQETTAPFLLKAGDGVTAWNSMDYLVPQIGDTFEQVLTSGKDKVPSSFAVQTAITAASGALDFTQVLTNGSDGSYITITNFGDFNNVTATEGTQMTNSVPGFWQIYTSSTDSDGKQAMVEAYADDPTPYVTLFVENLDAGGVPDNQSVQVLLYQNALTIGKNALNTNQLFPGAQYLADYSADFTARSLVDKGYVDGIAPASILTTRGDIIVRNATVPTRLALGGAGTILRSDGTDLVYSTNTYPNTTGVGQILYATSANIIGSASDFVRLTTGELIVGGTALVGAELLSFQKNANSLLQIRATNTTSGTAARTEFSAANSGAIISLSTHSSTYTTSGIRVAGSGGIYSFGNTAGAFIGTADAYPLTFWTNNTKRMFIDGAGNKVMGIAALATNATDGFLYIPTCAGTPTGVPTAQTGTVAMVWDSTNNMLMIYDGGWLGATNPGAFT